MEVCMNVSMCACEDAYTAHSTAADVHGDDHGGTAAIYEQMPSHRLHNCGGEGVRRDLGAPAVVLEGCGGGGGETSARPQ